MPQVKTFKEVHADLEIVLEAASRCTENPYLLSDLEARINESLVLWNFGDVNAPYVLGKLMFQMADQAYGLVDNTIYERLKSKWFNEVYSIEEGTYADFASSLQWQDHRYLANVIKGFNGNHGLNYFHTKFIAAKRGASPFSEMHEAVDALEEFYNTLMQFSSDCWTYLNTMLDDLIEIILGEEEKRPVVAYGFFKPEEERSVPVYAPVYTVEPTVSVYAELYNYEEEYNKDEVENNDPLHLESVYMRYNK